MEAIDAPVNTFVQPKIYDNDFNEILTKISEIKNESLEQSKIISEHSEKLHVLEPKISQQIALVNKLNIKAYLKINDP